MFQMVQALENPLDLPDHDHADDPSDPSLSQLDTLRRLFDVSIVTNAQK